MKLSGKISLQYIATIKWPAMKNMETCDHDEPNLEDQLIATAATLVLLRRQLAEVTQAVALAKDQSTEQSKLQELEAHQKDILVQLDGLPELLSALEGRLGFVDD